MVLDHFSGSVDHSSVHAFASAPLSIRQAFSFFVLEGSFTVSVVAQELLVLVRQRFCLILFSIEDLEALDPAFSNYPSETFTRNQGFGM